MKKRELLHLHGLLMTVAKEYVEREEMTSADLAEYHDVGVTPMSLQASRENHQEAVLELSAALAESTDEEAIGADELEPVAAE